MASLYYSGSSRFSHEASLLNRQKKDRSHEHEVEELTMKTSNLKIKPESNFASYSKLFKAYINPLLLTALSAFVRLYRIDAASLIVWDEAHFGKFGSYYLKREWYFDVHPPLGKLLVALSGYIAGYEGDFFDEEALAYPDDTNYYIVMRAFNCMFGILCTPLTYKTALKMGLSQPTIWLISLLTIFETISLTLSKFILLDSMLLFFTVLSFYCLVNLHNLRLRDELLSFQGFKWLFITGVSIGCVCSVKWVGLFVTALIGLYIIYDLLIMFYQVTSTSKIKVTTYISHWLSRILTLIILPFLIYLICFKVHFTVLNHSGPGDGSVSTLLQASLRGNTLTNGPRSIAFGSMVTLRSQGLSPNLLHSHPHLYPEGSRQQQITTYGFKDENNNFLIEFDLEKGLEGHLATREPEGSDLSDFKQIVRDGDTVRLIHSISDCLLHSHPIQAFTSKNHYEVSCYAGLDYSDSKDEWVIEIQEQIESPLAEFQGEDPTILHPVSTNFRLRHKVLGCYLATSGYSYPSWGYQQGEVICKKSFFLRDKNTWWNVEDHVNDQLSSPETTYVAPKPRFWKEFILLNYGMMASNNALVPDPDKFDRLSSEWWEWPLNLKGLRMSNWNSRDVKYFLIGHPFGLWFTTLCLVVFVLYSLLLIYRWQRQRLNLSAFDSTWETLLIQGVIPFMGWVLHYLPFIIMGRVTYLHHYVPALYFAIFVSGFLVERLVYQKFHRYVTFVVYGLLYALIIGVFWHWRVFSLGMDGPTFNYKHLRLLPSWMI